MPDDGKRDDTLGHLPPQVRAQAEEARRMKDEIRQSQQAQSAPPEPSEPEDERDAAETTGQTPPEPAKEPEATPPPAPTDEWKRKHDALFGKYSTEIGQARAKIRELEGEVARLTAAAAPKPEPKQEAAPGPKFDAKAFADYDGPIQELAATVARLEEESRGKDALIEQLGGQMEQRFNQKIEPLQQTVAQREYETFLAGVTAQVPHLDAINVDPDFLTWLNNTPNPYDPSFGSFGDTLRAAESRRNVEGVARIFNDFAAQSGNDKYAPPKAPEPEAAKPAPTPRNRNVQPSASHSSPATPDKGPRVWTEAEIGQFYRDIAQGKYVGRDDEVRAMKHAIFEAGQKGLVA